MPDNLVTIDLRHAYLPAILPCWRVPSHSGARPSPIHVLLPSRLILSNPRPRSIYADPVALRASEPYELDTSDCRPFLPAPVCITTLSLVCVLPVRRSLIQQGAWDRNDLSIVSNLPFWLGPSRGNGCLNILRKLHPDPVVIRTGCITPRLVWQIKYTAAVI